MELADKIVLYALGALEPAETAEFEKQLAGSPELQARVREERAVVGALALAPDPIAPSAALKQRLTTRIEAEAKPLQQRLSETARAKTAIASPSQPSQSTFLRDLLRGLTFGLAGLASLAALVLGITLLQTRRELAASLAALNAARDANTATQAALAASNAQVADLQAANVDLSTQLKDLQATSDALKKQSADAQTRIAAIQAQLASAQGDAGKTADALKTAQADLARFQAQLAIIARPDVRTAVLPAYKSEFNTGTVRMYYSPSAKSAVVAVSDLPKLPDDQCYQLWLIRGTDKLPSVVINTDSNGTGSTVVPSDLNFGEYELFGVTIEKAGGSPTPNPDGPVFLGDAAS